MQDAAAKTLFFVVLAALSLQYRMFLTTKLLDAFLIRLALGSKCDSWEDWLNTHAMNLGTIRNSTVLLLAFELSYQVGPGASHWLICTIAVLSVWDFGRPLPSGKPCDLYVVFFVHDLGALVCLLYQADEEDRGAARLNALIFPYLWFCHGWSGFDKVFGCAKGPKFGFEPADDSLVLRSTRWIYASGTVFCFYIYLFSPGQPGIGYNYQTASSMLLLGGRFHWSHLNDVAWMHSIELPGIALVVAVWCYVHGGPALALAPLALLALYKLVVPPVPWDYVQDVPAFDSRSEAQKKLQ